MISARGLVISSRHAISCSTELASTSMSCGATSSCPRRFAKPIGVWHAATATDASTTSMAVSGRYATDATQQPSWALVFRHRQPANHRAAQPSGTAHPQSSAGPDPRSRDGARHVAQAGARSGSSDGSSPGSCRHGRRPQLRSACVDGTRGCGPPAHQGAICPSCQPRTPPAAQLALRSPFKMRVVVASRGLSRRVWERLGGSRGRARSAF